MQSSASDANAEWRPRRSNRAGRGEVTPIGHLRQVRPIVDSTPPAAAEPIRPRIRRQSSEPAVSARRAVPTSSQDDETFRRGFTALANLALSGVQVTACAIDVTSGRVLFSVDDHMAVPTASVGEILLLIEVAARLQNRDESALGIVNRTAADTVAGSGIWQHLQVPALPIGDLAALIASTGDNLAANVLLRRIGLDAVRARGEQLGLKRTFLLDYVRDFRGPDDAPQQSVGSARELATLFARLAAGEVVDKGTSDRVMGWLGLGTDLSMVSSAFGLDAGAHGQDDLGLSLVSKTGTAVGIRSDAGLLKGPSGEVAYAVTMRFNDTSLAGRLAVIDGMRTLGTDILEYVF